MKMNNKLFLYVGLSLLIVAVMIRWLEVSSAIWIPVFCIAILLKGVFLVNVFRFKGFNMSLWLTLILIGVILILISLLFKYVFPVPVVRNILFYGAITFKISGLALMLVQKIKLPDREDESG